MSNSPSTIHRRISYLDFLNLLKRVLEFEQSLRFFQFIISVLICLSKIHEKRCNDSLKSVITILMRYNGF